MWSWPPFFFFFLNTSGSLEGLVHAPDVRPDVLTQMPTAILFAGNLHILGGSATSLMPKFCYCCCCFNGIQRGHTNKTPCQHILRISKVRVPTRPTSSQYHKDCALKATKVVFLLSFFKRNNVLRNCTNAAPYEIHLLLSLCVAYKTQLIPGSDKAVTIISWLSYLIK